jgi:hypothetical protein
MADGRQTLRKIADHTGGDRGGLPGVVSAAAARFDSPQELFGCSRDVVALRAG